MLSGCAAIKKGAVVGAGAGVGAGVATLASGGVAAPVVGAAVGGFVTDVVTGVGVSSAVKATKIVAAPDNLWSVAQKAVEVGGWGLVLFIIVPIILGWLLPGPTKLNRKK